MTFIIGFFLGVAATLATQNAKGISAAMKYFRKDK